jgi:hypothetical protein
MFLTPEEEYDIELTNLGYIQPTRPSKKLHGIETLSPTQINLQGTILPVATARLRLVW